MTCLGPSRASVGRLAPLSHLLTQFIAAFASCLKVYSMEPQPCKMPHNRRVPWSSQFRKGFVLLLLIDSWAGMLGKPCPAQSSWSSYIASYPSSGKRGTLIHCHQEIPEPPRLFHPKRQLLSKQEGEQDTFRKCFVLSVKKMSCMLAST